ncbi:BREX-1 system adenine-specific DNA-methyltransferase PglX [Robertkochia sediminum]|uniref:BREX-1 system adenine-specific DNA-methyltransferase PglX n=1 Tax=Robertkochia sediminum TaxID=2785326 RepID=UPI0019315110|nr:BREX-1 system adenine-specific DNA-methyltransferase PglX [Robertkochia sediminum]MBL7471374.1 BREX-1 system adenine-specific DNA-methyltransferase PglX [Robertkochia sediminum]
MNTNQLKRFAQETRKKLLQQVTAKLERVLQTDSAELRERAEALRQLKEAIAAQGKQAVADKVAYTWFNRLVALRFMDANAYQPIGVSVISPKEGYTLPELLDEAKQGHVPEELEVDKDRLYNLLDGKVPGADPQNEAFRLLLIAACNQLHQVFPFLFERINDYTELLLPDDLISEFSVIQDIRDGMTTEDCQEVEVLGWLYQFYISERKDEVFASKSKVRKEDIPAATQLFTPRWIVEYMVQNTVGKLWLQNNPNSNIKEHMPYYLESPSDDGDYLKINSPEEITLLDPACGSGHILVYGFELLTKIYEEQGYNPSEIPQLIIEKNLFGYEIDERAAQLAGFALMMKAREFYRRLLKKAVKPNILCYQDLALEEEAIKESFKASDITISQALIHDLKLMQQATNLGSLIIPKSKPQEVERVYEKVLEARKTADAFMAYDMDQIIAALEQLILLSKKYTCLVANPPYMGGGNMNKPLSDFVKTNYPDSKADLMACFMESGLRMLLPKGLLGMINQHSWMFLSSYEKLRGKLVENTHFDTMLHLGTRTFPEIGGEVVQNAAFTFVNEEPNKEGKYIRLVDYGNTELKRTKTLEAIQNMDCGWFYTASQTDFQKIPGSPIGYWLDGNFIHSFESEKIGDYGNSKRGLQPGNTPKVVRKWYEVTLDKIELESNSRLDSVQSRKKWFRFDSGGSTRKWYGNLESIVDWENNGFKIKNGHNPIVPSEHLYFTGGIVWSKISSGNPSFRLHEPGIIPGDASPCLYINENYKYFALGLLNSRVSINILELLAPTLNIKTSDIDKIPFLKQISVELEDAIKGCVEISRNEWRKRELFWDFDRNSLVVRNCNDIGDVLDRYKTKWRNLFFELLKLEELINNEFIRIYNLSNQIFPKVTPEEITILKEETSIENGELVFHADEVFAQFVSYAVGCMFGRYSLDKEGLILANQGETLEDYLKKVGKGEAELQFVPDDDNIIPVLDDEWFEDDIVGRFYAFLKASFGEENFEKNLAFVEESLGKDIRKYFVKDFYKDHIKRYKKRPIYWMFSSPKGSFNVLIYMHRYTPDTLNNILNGYLKEYREKLKGRMDHLEHIATTGSSSEQTKATKEMDKIREVLRELQEYEREILYPLATERIAIDLDDGVLVNYNKFAQAIKEVSGLNDKKTKAKVKKFDWIDTSTIR